jgi:DNA-binding beta-propeller fold protein YncE
MRVLLFACFLLSCSSPENGTAPAVDTGVAPVVGDVEDFAEIGGSTEGIAFSVDGKQLYVGSGGALFVVQPDGTARKWVDVPGALGIAARADGHLLVCGKEGDAGVIFDVAPDGKRTVLVSGGFKQTNFVAVAPDNAIVFSDSAGDRVYRANADGTAPTVITDAIVYPNGLAFSRDGKTLYVASWKNKQVLALARRADGTYDAPVVFVDGVENVDGLAVGASGDLYLIANGLGVLRANAGKTSVVAPGSRFKLVANGAFSVGSFGQGWMYVTNLIGFSVQRVYVGEGGFSLPAR